MKSFGNKFKFPLFVLAFIFFNCKNEINKAEVSNLLKSQSFTITSEKDSPTIEFNDSTYQIFEYDVKNIPWDIVNINNYCYLTLNTRAIRIRKIGDDYLEGVIIDDRNKIFSLKRNNKKFETENLNGTWVDEKYNRLIESRKKNNLSPPPPPIIVDSSEKSFTWLPTYKIQKDSIIFTNYSQKAVSKFEISKSSKFISLHLRNEKDETELLWAIKKLNDRSLKVQKQFISNTSYHEKKNITLIKVEDSLTKYPLK